MRGESSPSAAVELGFGGFEVSVSVPGRFMGDLTRGSERWDVYLEMVHDAELDATRGRVHFVSAAEARSTSWIFLEWKEADVSARFADLSPLELWTFLESLGPAVTG